MVGQGQQAQLKLVVEFDELSKALICNKTNATTIAKVLASDDTDDWPGQRIVLYVNDGVQFGGETVSAIRVRSKAPQQQKRQQAAPSNGVLSYPEAVALCATVGITKDDLVSYLKQNGLTGYNGVLATPLVRKLVAGFEPPDAPPPSDANEDEIPW